VYTLGPTTLALPAGELLFVRRTRGTSPARRRSATESPGAIGRARRRRSSTSSRA